MPIEVFVIAPPTRPRFHGESAMTKRPVSLAVTLLALAACGSVSTARMNAGPTDAATTEASDEAVQGGTGGRDEFGQGGIGVGGRGTGGTSDQAGISGQAGMGGLTGAGGLTAAGGQTGAGGGVTTVRGRGGIATLALAVQSGSIRVTGAALTTPGARVCNGVVCATGGLSP
jgi:hypothetical protein